MKEWANVRCHHELVQEMKSESWPETEIRTMSLTTAKKVALINANHPNPLVFSSVHTHGTLCAK